MASTIEASSYSSVSERSGFVLLCQTALWRLGLGQFPGITKKPIDTACLHRLIKKEDPVILEIGASDGEHTQWLINSFRNQKVYCFEPAPRAFTRHQNLIGNHSAVSLFPVAISDQVGTIEFYQSSGTPPWDGFDHIKDSGWDFSGSIKKAERALEDFSLGEV